MVSDMTQIDARPMPQVRRHRWPLTPAAAGAVGLATVPLVSHPRLTLALGWVAASLLLLSAAQWRRWVEPRVRASTAAHAMPLGLIVAAGGLAYGMSWTGWSGVAISAAALAWMGLRERTVSRWVGWVSLGPPVGLVLLVAHADGSPAGPAPVAGVVLLSAWLVVTGLGLALGRSTIAR